MASAAADGANDFCCAVCKGSSQKLLRCSQCKNPDYLMCSKECQRVDWKRHKKAECAVVCVKCKSKVEVRYGKCPYPPYNDKGKLMCGKCASWLGVQLTDWVYPNPKIHSEWDPPRNPFERVCAQCRVNECTEKCPDCDLVWYCNDACRTAHRAKHEAKCRLLQRKGIRYVAGTEE